MAQQNLNEIANIRSRQGLSRAQLAKASRVPAAKLAAYESGTEFLPQHHQLRLATALRVGFEDLARKLPAPTPKPVYVAPPRSDDPIQAEIDDLTRARVEIECKDRWSKADEAEFRRINTVLNAAYERLAARDATDAQVSA